MDIESSILPSQSLRNKNISQLGRFLKKITPKKETPEWRREQEITLILSKVVGHPFSKKYLTKELCFKKNFVTSLAFLHSYMEEFRKIIPLEPFFDIEQFPLFLLEKYSTPKQKEMYASLTDTDKIEDCIAKNGLSGAKRFLESLLALYEKSFSAKQLFKIHKILDLGFDFKSFIGYNLKDFLLALYPSYLQDEDLSSLNSEYEEISCHNFTKELTDFLKCLSCLKSNTHYYPFLEHYENFLGRKFISYPDFQLFFLKVREFFQDDILLSILKLQTQDELFYIPSSIENYEFNKFPAIVDYISLESYKKQKSSRLSYAHKMEEALLSYLFDKPSILRIEEQQNMIDNLFKKNHKERSFSSLCIVLAGFGNKIYYSNILPNLQFLLKHSVFLLEDFRRDLSIYTEVTSQALKNAKEIFDDLHKALKLPSQNQNSIEVRSRTTCQEFLEGTGGLLHLLKTIIDVAKEELKTNVTFVIPRETMGKLLGNLQVSQTLIEKVYVYVRTFMQVVTIL